MSWWPVWVLGAACVVFVVVSNIVARRSPPIDGAEDKHLRDW